MINIANLDKAAVVAALFNASRAVGLGIFGGGVGKTMTTEEAQAIIDAGKKRIQDINQEYGMDDNDGKNLAMAYDFDYLQGRVMKVDLSQDEFEERLFDRDNGSGAAARAIDAIRPK